MSGPMGPSQGPQNIGSYLNLRFSSPAFISWAPFSSSSQGLRYLDSKGSDLSVHMEESSKAPALARLSLNGRRVRWGGLWSPASNSSDPDEHPVRTASAALSFGREGSFLGGMSCWLDGSAVSAVTCDRGLHCAGEHLWQRLP